MRVLFNIAELEPWLERRYGPASGPGGQNVNKVSTRATILFDFRACSLLSERQIALVSQRLSTRRARDGRIRVVAQAARTQAANRELAEQRLLELLARSLHVPRTRRPTRPTVASRRRRLDEKRRRGQIKRSRRAKPSADD